MTDAPHSVYRPTPEAPSPWWSIAARRLGWVVTVTRVALPLGIVAGGLGLYGRASLSRLSSAGAQVAFLSSAIVQMLRYGVTSIAWVLAFAALARLPLPADARRLARVALGVAVFDLLRPFAANAATAALLRHASTSSVSSFASWSIAMQGVGFVLDLASIAVSTAALVRVARAAAPARAAPIITWAVVAAAMHVWTPIQLFVEPFAHYAWPAVTWGLFALSTALSITFVVGWTRALRGLADDLAPQTAPDVAR